VLRFRSGSALVVVSAREGTVDARLHQAQPAQVPAGPQPTRRQREYLEFIQKYMARHGCAPAKSDIQDHFMVSGPSAHQMVKAWNSAVS